ncbi:hypothetical protein [uncultured Olleya sp.]|uniref:HD domain-containing protein n=1 Tax=uncultured Olleya sp. TaxID=757243 RepID=UPI00048FF3D8|nr:hypothetical protein [uncultured Olleya sp.]
MIDWLKTEWHNLAIHYCDQNLSNILWKEIETHYTLKNKHYHNLSHLFEMLKNLKLSKPKTKDLDSLKFAIWYHDIIYKPTRNDNEEKSALFAKKRLKKINIEQKRIKTVQELILSTKKHNIILTQNQDNAIILDLDLQILSSDWDTYSKYVSNIRKEYKIYPDFMYNSGRKKALTHFLKKDTIYFTKNYIDQHENQARQNLKQELDLL